MQDRLNELARELEACRRRGNQMTLEHILESARILEEAMFVADGDFGTWLKTQGRYRPSPEEAGSRGTVRPDDVSRATAEDRR